jgi:hypothetical protein
MRTRLICLALMAILLSSNVCAQWIQTSGPYGGNIRCLLPSENRIFVGTTGCIYVSTNSGATWATAASGIGDVRVIGSNPTHLFAGTSTGIFVSTDNGHTWTAANNGFPEPPQIHSLAVTESCLFAGTDMYGIYLSTNNGASWTAVNTGLPITSSLVSALALSGNNLFAFLNARGVFRSTDQGANWVPVWDSPGWVNFMSLAVRDSLVLLGVDYSPPPMYMTYRSTDNGDHWTQCSSVPDTTCLRSFVFYDTTIFACSDHGIFRSSINSTEWTQTEAGPGMTGIDCIAISDTNLFAGNEGGVSRSTDWGNTWEDVNTGLIHSTVTSVAIVSRGTIDTLIFAGTWGVGVQLSTDGGMSWMKTGGELPDCDQLIASDTVLYARRQFQIFRSRDKGASWTSVGDQWGQMASAGVSSLVALGSNVFAGTTGYGVFLSTDEGTSWTPVNTGLPSKEIFSLAASDGPVFAGTAQGVFRSTDKGSSWTSVNGDVAPFTGKFLAAVGPNIYSATDFDFFSLTTDGGEHWRVVTAGLQTPIYFDALGVKGRDVFLSTTGGVYLLNQAKSGWIDVNENLPTRVMSFAFAGADVLVGTLQAGVWRRPLSELVSVSMPTTEVPASFALAQNYPNPFNPSTTIRYALPHRSRVSLIVYNTLGQQVATLVNGEVEAGYHEVTFNANGLASGVYFYRMTAGDFVQTKRLVLLH